MNRAIQSELGFAVPDGQQFVFHASNRDKSHMPTERISVPINDVRPIADNLSFDRNGFMLARRATAMTDASYPDQIEHIYLPEIRQLVKDLTGAEEVACWGVVVRTDREGASDSNKPAQFAHLDCEERSVRQFAREVLGAKAADRLLRRRFMQFNIWRPLKPVERSPLALADASTIRPADLELLETYGGLNDPTRPVMYGFMLMHNPVQRWYYAPLMQPDEAWVFKMFDSDPSKTSLTAHTAFQDPTSPDDAAPRESVEVRVVAFMPEDDWPHLA